MKKIIYLLILCTAIYGQALKEKITLNDGRILKLYKDGTYNFEQNTIKERYTYEDLKIVLRGKSQLEVKEIVGKPLNVWSNNNLKDDNNEYVNILNDKLKGDRWIYGKYNKILWNPILEEYEKFVIHFYKGKAYSIVRNEDH